MKFPKPFVKGTGGNVYAVIETPKGSRNKYDYVDGKGMYELSKVLPSGTVFPLDFGFIPHTLAEDGDPLDILVISDTPGFTGCLLECRIIGVIEATQKEKNKKKERNDRVLAVQDASLDHSQLKNIKDLNKHMLDELEHFFEYYNKMCGKKFKMVGVAGPKKAIRLIKKHAKDFKE